MAHLCYCLVLTGFTQAIREVYPQTVAQLFVIHQIRNSCKYVSCKYRKEFLTDIKSVYGAANRQNAWHALEGLAPKWGKKYGYAISSWQNNWETLTQYFDYPVEIRTISYTTNVIDSQQRGIHKYTRAKTLFPDD